MTSWLRSDIGTARPVRAPGPCSRVSASCPGPTPDPSAHSTAAGADPRPSHLALAPSSSGDTRLR